MVTADEGGDNRLNAYLMDTDCMVTAEKGFVGIFEA